MVNVGKYTSPMDGSKQTLYPPSVVYTPGTQMTLVLIGSWTLFWRTNNHQHRGHSQVPGTRI